MSSVDVVIPCHNYGRYLRDCVRSVLEQQEVDVRVLIIDDASADETPQVGRELAAADARVEYRRHPTNLGHIATYNEGLLDWARADYSVLLSADDLLTSGSLARAAAIMDARPDVGLVYGTAIVFFGDSSPPVGGDVPADTRIVSGERFLERCFLGGNPVPTPTAVVRTRLQHEIGGYDPDLPHTADMEMWMRFGVHGHVGVVKAVQALYRRHAENMSWQYTRRSISDRQEVLRACQRIVDRWGERVPRSREWLRALRRRLASESIWAASAALDQGDAEGLASCLEFSVRADPWIRLSSLWWRLAVKRAVGRERALRIRQWRRGAGRSAPERAAPAANQSFEFGWWQDQGT